MFSGIVYGMGVVGAFRKKPGSRGAHLAVELPAGWRKPALGASISVNGVCLTVTAAKKKRGRWNVEFDLLEETCRRSNLRDLKAGEPVNLEPALRAGDEIGGHFVQGHVDGTGVVRRSERRGSDLGLVIRPPRAFSKYLAAKGSVAVDGVSLTVAGLSADGFRVWIIPHTARRTNLASRRPGDRVNLEADLLAKLLLRRRPRNRAR
ncbi:MAG: riboflavin synthase [Verrucomicrobiae bacterium]|nr:riboflavin synthase [Verrucomicrobiae bacterium]